MLIEPLTANSLPSTLERSPLLQKLQGGLSGRLTLITAPAGYGKTTLIRQWLATNPGAAIALLALTDQDGDQARFFGRLGEALRTSVPRFDASAFTPFDTGNNAAPVDIAEALSCSLAGVEQPVVLVIDDFQYLDANPLILETFNHLLDSPPANLHLLLASRTEPDLRMSQLRLQQQLTELTMEDLRFNATETRKLCSALDQPEVSQNTLDSLLRLTEGWVTGLRLALLAARRSGEEALENFAGHQPDVMAYFGDIVLRGLPDSLRGLCLQSALFDRINGPLCDQVLRHSGSAVVLEELARQQLFLMPMEHEAGWYRFHPLLRSFLQTRLEREAPELLPELHSRAADSFLKMGDLHQALKHAQANGQQLLLANVLEAAFTAWAREGHFSGILFWEYRLQGNPILLRTAIAVPLICSLILSGRFDQAATMLEIFRRRNSGEVSADHHRVLVRFLALYLELFQNDTRFISRDDYDDLVQHSRHYDIYPLCLCMAAYHHLQHARPARALDYARQGQEALKQTGHHFMADYAGLIIALCHRSLGRPGQATRVVEQAYSTMAPHGANRILRSTAMVVALYDQNRLAEAASLCNDLLPKLNKTSAIEVIATVYLTHARCLFASGQTDKATHFLAKLEHILEPARNQRFLSHLLAERLRQAWLGKGRERAEILAQRSGLARKLQTGEWDQPQGYTEQRERQGLATVYWLRAAGRPSTAARILRVLAMELRETGLVSRALVIDTNRHLCEHANDQDSRQTVNNLIHDYGLHNLTRNLFDEAPGFGSLLSAATGQGLELPENYLALYGTLLAERTAANPAPATQLTAREQTIYGLLLEGLNNRQISEQTGNTLSTIKWHLKNIYAKLGVSNRTEAVLLATAKDRRKHDA